MATSTPTPDIARKTRMIDHMNNDHQDELVLYLRHFCKIPRRQIQSPLLVDITNEGLDIIPNGSALDSVTASGCSSLPGTPDLGRLAARAVTVKFPEGRLTSLDPGIVRERVVAMAQTARRGLGLQDVTITTYLPPTGLGLLAFGGVWLYFGTAAFLPLLLDHAWPARAWLDAYFPVAVPLPGLNLAKQRQLVIPPQTLRGAEAFAWIIQAMLLPVLAIHVAEAWWFARTRCAPYNIDSSQSIWWLWVSTCFVEGFTTFWRFDALVETERAKHGKVKKVPQSSG